MRLLRAEASLARLTRYLVVNHRMAPALERMMAVWSPEEDRRNLENPRGCCHVESNQWRIFCSQIIEHVTPEVRIGILIHEIGHLYIPAMSSEKSEVDVDGWILAEVPEAGYGYIDYTYYNPLWKKDVTAKNIQAVSTGFVYNNLA